MPGAAEACTSPPAANPSAGAPNALAGCRGQCASRRGAVSTSHTTFTIAARATPPAAGGVGIIRLSGPLALEVGRRLVPALPAQVEPRHAYFAAFCDRSGATVDEGIFVYFRAPHSYTGEDVVELQAHGGVRLLELLLSEVLRDDRVRLAEPGEFTRRAYLNGRMDLARAEAVADLVAAESEAAVRAAAAQVRGELSTRLRAHRERLLALHADLEGALNFPDEAEGAEKDAASRIAAELTALRTFVDQAGRGRLIRRGARVALFGPPNAGKSTLFNALLGEERALVDEEPGTTRDALEAKLEVRGVSLTVVDTAGLREAPGRVEAKGVERTRAELKAADLALLVLEASDRGADGWLREVPPETPVLRVASKADLGGSADGLHVSAKTGEGVRELMDAVFQKLFGGGVVDAVTLTTERHVDALRRTVEALERAKTAAEVSTLEVVAGEVALAFEALGEITGENASESLLDEIFRRFCIGK